MTIERLNPRVELFDDRVGTSSTSGSRLMMLTNQYGGYPPSPRSFGIMELGGNSCQIFGFKGLAGKFFKNQRLSVEILPFGFVLGQDFGSGLPASTTLRVAPAKRLKLTFQRTLKIGLGQFSRAVLADGPGTAPIRSLSLSLRAARLMSMDFDHG
jgi:hypothetical protein